MRRILLALAVAACAVALAQVDLRGEIELATDAAASGARRAQAGWTIAARLAVDVDLAPASVHLVLDPSVRFGATVAGEPGLTEAFALATLRDADVSVGLERLPLETARLSVPYGVESVDRRGIRRGVWGARADYYQDGRRWRAAVFLDPRSERLAPLVGVRANFGSFELEARALFPGELVVGLGGSGLVGDLVVYGEAWLLTDPWEARAALGVTGSLRDGGWTIEGGYLAPAGGLHVADLAGVPPPVPRPALNAQLAWALDAFGDRSLTLGAGAAFDPDAVRTRLSAGYGASADDRAVNVSLVAALGPEPAALNLNLSVRHFF